MHQLSMTQKFKAKIVIARVDNRMEAIIIRNNYNLLRYGIVMVKR